MSEPAPHAELVLYATEDGSAQFFLRAEGCTVWMTQQELADLFQTTKQNISLHVRNVLVEGELQAEAVVKQDLTTAADGKRYRTQLYNLDMILAIGYRVKSPRGTQFRQWATTHLKEYLIKGFVMDDERLKGGEHWDYFDELLERIRDIRSSEKRFYQKVRDLFALSVDYADDGQATGIFFAEVQNKMFFAVTGHTAAELIVQRADPTQPNMALTSWKGGRVRKADATVAKNYLNVAELDQLNRIVSMFLDFAELRAMQRKDLRMAEWRAYVDSFMAFNEQPVLQGPGRMSHQAMTDIAHARYEQFDAARRKTEALEADLAELRDLEQVERQINSQRQNGKRGKDVT
ncbi:virulence RhuM family protein [Burkholderia ubonensis]|uniref:virulence RhuM family protein n=1 Tax=Burkholderia ubonensis TaxID=101571 RepID=UPI000754137A|nr:virulence RhuM family protein [Burkholderia ubonensis]KWN06884.1 hydroxyacid dehydrogenase [Burkholderia ubonensis]